MTWARGIATAVSRAGRLTGGAPVRKAARLDAARAYSAQPQVAFDKMYTENYLNIKRLPVPALEDTMKRYLRSVEPLVTPAEFEQVQKECADFVAGPGPKLQATLLAEDSHEGYPYSYIQKHWDDMYLGLRCPEPVNVSPFFKIADAGDLAKGQTRRAAEFVCGFTRWTRKVLNGTLEPDLDGKGNPQCNTSFSLMFSSSKTPVQGRDIIEQYPNSRTVTVVNKGNLYAVEVISEDGKLISVDALDAQFKKIMQEPAAADSICVLSTEDRDVWAKTRAKMMADPANATALKAVDQGIIAVCLDEDSVSDMSWIGQSILCGPAESRWCDKQQLLAYKSGEMAMNFEHSYSDGLGWARFIHEVMCDIQGKQDKLPKNYGPLPKMEVVDSALGMEKLSFNISDDVKSTIATAQTNYKALQDSVDTAVLEFNHFGKNEMKKWNCSPDAAIQMAYQVAFYKLHKEMPGVYESCATRRFFHGRTETIRSTTPDSWALAKAIVDGTGGDKLALLQTAAKTHSDVSREAAGGMGCDRHLLVLNYLANRDMAGSVPSIFQNPAFVKSKTWMLSTSNASSTPYIDLFGFGAVAVEGYGCGYLIFNDSVHVNCTSFKGTSSLGSANIRAKIEETLLEFKQIYDSSQ